MSNILIGSRAIKHWFPDFSREPRDYDFLVDEIPLKKENNSEYHVIPYIKELSGDKNFLDADLIYTLKCSHVFWNIKWEKHIFDIVFMKSKGCKLNKKLFFDLYEFWKTKHGDNKRSELNMTKEDFFNNAMPKDLPSHDYIHTLLNKTPTYTKVLKDGADVDVDENKFNKLTHEEKLELVREEVYVMAWERLGGRDYRSAYNWMLKKFIISHAPIYEALFIIENYYELRKPIYNFKQKIEHELSRA